MLESLCCVQWNTYTPEADFVTACNGQQYAAMILQQGGPEALAQWKRLEEEMRPLQQGAATFPAAALRSDLGKSGLACFLHGEWPSGLLVSYCGLPQHWKRPDAELQSSQQGAAACQAALRGNPIAASWWRAMKLAHQACHMQSCMVYAAWLGHPCCICLVRCLHRDAPKCNLHSSEALQSLPQGCQPEGELDCNLGCVQGWR